MPPQRTTAKTPVKTERTHEENQERAYIAASRRSDRSLEARIESARRASEIHKKRTGRGLRVTEEDVVNEEMYEEDDDDGPGQMRRMQAYMAMANAGNIFDGRLNSYLMSQMATRNMLLHGGGFNPNMNNPNQPTTFFSYTPPQAVVPGQMQPPQTVQQPAMGFNPQQPPQQQQQRMAGLPLHQIQTTSPMFPTTVQAEQEAQSRARQSIKADSPVQRSPVSQTQSPVQQSPNMQSMSHGPPSPKNLFEGYNQSQQTWQGQQSYAYPNDLSSINPTGGFYGSSMNLMSATLPVEAQQMFGTNAFDLSDSNTAQLMNQNHGMPIPPNGIRYSYNPNLSSFKTGQDQFTSTGMNQTLSQSNYPASHNLRGEEGDQSSPFSNNYSFGTPTNEFGDIFDDEGAQNFT